MGEGMTQNRSTDKEAPMKTDRESVERLLDDVDRYSRPAYGEAFLSSPMRASKHRTIAATLRALLDENEALRGERDEARADVVEFSEVAAALVEEMSKRPQTTWGQVRAAIRALGDLGDRRAHHLISARAEAAEARLEAAARAALDGLTWARHHMRKGCAAGTISTAVEEAYHAVREATDD